MTTDDGTQMKSLYGPGYTGLSNLGNRYSSINSSCYLASVVQTIFSIPSFQDKYFKNSDQHVLNCHERPAECFLCQMAKLGNGLLSGKYSQECGDNQGISPYMFKSVIGKGHSEFSTMRQQDYYY